MTRRSRDIWKAVTNCAYGRNGTELEISQVTLHIGKGNMKGYSREVVQRRSSYRDNNVSLIHSAIHLLSYSLLCTGSPLLPLSLTNKYFIDDIAISSPGS